MKLTKQQLITKLGMLPVGEKGLTYEYYDAFQEVKEIILNAEIIPDPEPAPQVDTELEEARKRFPVGSWFTVMSRGSTLRKIESLSQDKFGIKIRSDEGITYCMSLCTPATLPTRKVSWRCMKTDAPDTARTVLINLDGKYYSAYHSKGSIWYVEGFSINMSNYTSALWCELSEIEGE